MKRLQKIAVSLGVVGFLTSTVAGCGSGSSSSGNKTTITWMVRGTPAENQWEQKVINYFEKQHPNIQVQLIVIPQSEIDQKLQTMFAAGDPPDVFAPNWVNAGFRTYQQDLLNLTPFLKKDPKLLAGFNSKAVATYTVNGQLLAIPMNQLGSFLFYNKDMFKKAGLPDPPTNWNDKSWTWAKMVEDAKALTKGSAGNEQYGVLDSFDPNEDSWLWGGDFFTQQTYQTGVVHPALNNPLNKKAMQAHYDLVFQSKVSPNASETNALNALGDPFLTGKVAMELTGGWGLWTYQPAPFHWGVAALPYTGPGERDFLYTDCMGIAKKSKHQQAAWELLQTIVNPNTGLKWYMEMTDATPPQKDLLNEWYQRTSKETGIPVQQLEQVQDGATARGEESPNHMVAYYNAILNVLNQAGNSVYSGTLSIDSAIAQIKSGLKPFE
ncbi:sugar ABC transporter substrate-binding protein [Alicyclobacillus fastidiosus]|uniref:Sugar ABC transporter substrate-binding protein n=1 Tax=Alicyclobacillus fastidiosus TaxID=392011 RepID=A0ABY6ZMJ6_9BACL|nr:sugar ABC transporter substrate-binding protein [Alicyclobacillus fastidiosus]WAH44158.1 sugar ABC transporter substrate-binding protein [Alicyclobacillus fastidiosus]GMA60465.1 hypothetical protein GCM10025859_09050 [Alicyclobacillus fastidiosus]